MKLPAIRKIALFLATAVFFFGAGVWFGQGKLNFSLSDGKPEVRISRQVPAGRDVDFALFWQVWDRLEASYFDKSKIDPAKMVYGAIRGMVSSLGDPYTVFLEPSEQKRTEEDLGGEFEGVGIQIGFKGSQLAVIAPLPETPADKAGVRAGDFIVGIKDEREDVDRGTYGMSLPDAVELIRGPAGTRVTLVLTRKGQDEPFEVAITRARIEVPSVELAFVGEDEGIAHLKLLRFGEQTNGEWGEAISQIAKSKSPIAGLILDLRNNPGGFLQGSVQITSEFLTRGVVVIQEDGQGARQEFKVSGQARLSEIKLVVLVNEGSASASEIVAAALQDSGRAKVVGEKTFGKGTIQEAQELDSAGLHITTAKWLTPKGNWLDEKGLTPDIEIADDPDTETDEQLERAIEELGE